MKRFIFYLSSGLLLCVVPAYASLKDQVLVVESDELDDSESLNRISGDIDLGFSLPEQSYESKDHYRPGPFGREEANDSRQSY